MSDFDSDLISSYKVRHVTLRAVIVTHEDDDFDPHKDRDRLLCELERGGVFVTSSRPLTKTVTDFRGIPYLKVGDVFGKGEDKHVFLAGPFLLGLNPSGRAIGEVEYIEAFREPSRERE
jgi:hypothetical protein